MKKSIKFFISSLLPLVVVSLFSCISFTGIMLSMVRSNVAEKAKSSMQELASSVDKMLNSTVVALTTFEEFSKTESNPRELQKLVEAFQAKFDYVDSMYYGTQLSRFSGGIYVDSSIDWIPEDDWEPKDGDWFKMAFRAGGEISFQDAYVDEEGALSVTIAKAVRNSRMQFDGVVGVDIRLDVLTEIVDEIRISENSNVYIVDSNGKYMTNKDSSKWLENTFFDDISENLDREDFLDGIAKVIIEDGRFYAVRKIGQTPWFAVAEGPISDFSMDMIVKLIVVVIFLIMISVGCAVSNSLFIRKVLGNEKSMGRQLFGETQNLVVATKETAATSQDQSAAVKEIVATMEDSTALSENISMKIESVSKIAHKTSSDVISGVESLASNLEKLHEIFTANHNTIEGIKALGNKIENIWDIVTLINSVADQAKIIAFNAELEASKAGESGKNFHIVASEIRRLADGIIDGTKEIKEKITEIQQSSDSLILMSESGTEKINEGCENAKHLELMFESIRGSAEITADSSEDITNIIQQQTSASEQILITLKQIAAGVDNFSQATENISSSAENIRKLAEDLNGKQ